MRRAEKTHGRALLLALMAFNQALRAANDAFNANPDKTPLGRRAAEKAWRDVIGPAQTAYKNDLADADRVLKAAIKERDRRKKGGKQ